jgi:hypothetical protein
MRSGGELHVREDDNPPGLQNSQPCPSANMNDSHPGRQVAEAIRRHDKVIAHATLRGNQRRLVSREGDTSVTSVPP